MLGRNTKNEPVTGEMANIIHQEALRILEQREHQTTTQSPQRDFTVTFDF